MKIINLCLIFTVLLSFTSSLYAIDMIYLDATSQFKPRFVTSADDEDICRGRNGLTGLDKTRKILGLETYDGQSLRSTLVEEINCRFNT